MNSNFVRTPRYHRHPGLILGVIATFCAGALSAQDKQLILQTDPEPTVIDLTGSLQIDSDGSINATPVDPEACTATGTCEGVAVDITSFSANSQESSVSVSQGTALEFRWASRGAWACDGGGLTGWTGTGKLPTNTAGESVATGTLNPGNYTATLACYNGTIQADPQQSIAIEVVEDSNPPPEGCENRTLPSDWVRLTDGGNSCSYKYGTAGHGLDTADDCRFFGKTDGHNGVWPWPWPEQTSFQKVLGVPSDNNGKYYIALEFNSGSIPSGTTRTINVNLPQTSSLENERKLISISQCPGDFNKSAIDTEMGAGCIMASFTSGIQWGGADKASDMFVCGLESNTRYYFNVIFTSSTLGTSPANMQPNCTNTAGCGSRFTPSGN